MHSVRNRAHLLSAIAHRTSEAEVQAAEDEAERVDAEVEVTTG